MMPVLGTWRPIDVVGSISSNNVDAPDGFPDVRGVIRRVRTEWQPVAASETDRLLAPVADARTRWTGCLIDLDLTTA
jgi:hypothetical protein